MISTDPAVWIGAALIIAMTTLAWKETTFSRWGEYTALGAYMGIQIVNGTRNIRTIGFYNLGIGKIEYIIPIILGVLIYSRYVKKYMWMARYGTALLMGASVGDTLRAVFKAQVIDQITATIQPIYGTPPDIFQNVLGLLLAASATWYFIFTVPRAYKGRAPSAVSRVAKYGMLMAFGTAFAGSVMARINSYSAAALYLLENWLGIVG
jgi:hypothetical protein